jgi:uncharacterized protein (TIGR02246 family)
MLLASPILVVGACSTSGDSQLVRAALTELIAADNLGDLDRIADSYVVDAVLLPPNAEPVHGRDAIRESYERGFARFGLRVELAIDRTWVCGDLAACHGTTSGAFVWRDGSPPTPFEDTFSAVMARGEDRRWRIASLMWFPRPRADSAPASVGQEPRSD